MDLIKPGIPGNISKEKYIQELIRVDQAGERGALRIYEGQLKVVKNPDIKKEIEHMLDQEKEHLKYFNEQIIKRGVRPTALNPLWDIAGFALGVVTAKMGDKAAMACTVAVEEVIDEHYQEQYNTLDEDELELKEKIKKFRDDELEHKETGIAHNAEQAPFYDLLSFSIKKASKLAIFLSKKI